MELQTFLFVIMLLLFGGAVYSVQIKRGQILVHYTGIDKTEEEKWISIKSGYVIFRGRKFDIITRRITSFWLNRGIHYLFPTKVNYLKYSWYSRFPHDPDDYKNVWETPEVRNAINKAELVKSYFQTSTPATAKKQSAIMQYLPLISIVMVILVGFYLYSNMQVMQEQLGAMDNMIRSIAK